MRREWSKQLSADSRQPFQLTTRDQALGTAEGRGEAEKGRDHEERTDDRLQMVQSTEYRTAEQGTAE